MDASDSAKKQYGAYSNTHHALTNITARYHHPLRPPVKTGKLASKGELPFLITPKYSLACRPKVEEPTTDAEPMFPLPPFCQTPGPISVSQSYLQRLILERWEAEVKACEKEKTLQLLEIAPGPALPIIQASLQRLVIECWDAEVKHCEKAKQAQLLELLLAAHGISRLV